MGRFIVNPLLEHDKDDTAPTGNTVMARGRAERLLLLTLRLWALKRRAEEQGHAMGEWRQTFLASLEPVFGAGRVSIAEGALEDALADFDGFLATIISAPDHIWRFHHPRCLGIDADEMALLNVMRLVQLGEIAAASALLHQTIAGERVERALRYLGSAVKALRTTGLGLPHVRADGHSDRGLNLTH